MIAEEFKELERCIRLVCGGRIQLLELVRRSWRLRQWKVMGDGLKRRRDTFYGFLFALRILDFGTKFC